MLANLTNHRTSEPRWWTRRDFFTLSRYAGALAIGACADTGMRVGLPQPDRPAISPN